MLITIKLFLFVHFKRVANFELAMLHWFKRSPAGLKLVAELSHFLSGLFSYYTQLSFGILFYFLAEKCFGSILYNFVL